MLDEKIRILIVEGRFHEAIADELLKGAVEAIGAFGAEHDVVTVPSALEIPAVVAMAEEGGPRPAGVRYDGFVALGCVIRGETYQFEILADQTARGLMDLAVGKKLAIGDGVLTVETEEQAWARARVSEGDRGGFAARACLDVIGVKRRLLGAGR
jgi:6,7-dimethyl-8-ribityllumazine synthase